jgi:hypothetical protein
VDVVAAPVALPTPLDLLAQILAAIAGLSKDVVAVKECVGDIESGKVAPGAPAWDPFPEAMEWLVGDEAEEAHLHDIAVAHDLAIQDFENRMGQVFTHLLDGSLIAPVPADNCELGGLFPD